VKPTEVLKEEHKAIKVVLTILEAICTGLESGKPANVEHLEKIVEFIRVFADTCHHGKEEDLLFPAMVAAGIPKNGGPIAVMLLEHTEGRNYVKNMAAGLEGYKNGNAAAAKLFIENARNYSALLTQHIDKEDNILYQIADARISADEQNKLLKEFERVEIEKIGAGKHEEFHEMIKKLKSVYLT
jgi:hemerythrin-like domain-containing protein